LHILANCRRSFSSYPKAAASRGGAAEELSILFLVYNTEVTENSKFLFVVTKLLSTFSVHHLFLVAKVLWCFIYLVNLG
jgi:hypothetical protein